MTGWEVVTQELCLPMLWPLGGGGEAVWAPDHPTRWQRPGFRDPALFHGFPVEPVFAWSLLDHQGRWIPLVAERQRSTPAFLDLHSSADMIHVNERRTVLSSDVFVSQAILENRGDSARDFWIVLWTRRPVHDSVRISEVEANQQAVSFVESHHDEQGQELVRAGWAIGSNLDADSWSVSHSRVAGVDIDWPSTPFVHSMSRSGLPGQLPPGLDHYEAGYLFLAMAYPLTVPPGDSSKICFYAAPADDAESARAHLDDTSALIDPIHASEEEWIQWFDEVPSFECSDPMIQRAYWFRWAQRRIWHSARRPVHTNAAPLVEGGGWIEDGWRLSLDDTVESVDRIFQATDRPDHDIPLALLLRRLLALHPNEDWASELQAPLRRSLGRWETDAKFSSAVGRSLLRSKCWTLDCWRLLAELADDEESCQAEIRPLIQAIRDEHWNSDREWFDDVLAGDGPSNNVRTLYGLLPMLVGVTSTVEESAIAQAVFDPEYFWTSPPLPSVCRSDPRFRPNLEGFEALDGRVCPSLVSLAIECLGLSAEQKTPQDRLLLAQVVLSAIRVLFPEGDVDRPACHVSYHPMGGYPSAMLGVSPPSGWLIDHIIRLVAGVRPTETGVVILDPLPTGIEWFKLERVVIGDHELDVEWDQRTGLAVRIDGQPAGHAPIGRALRLHLHEPPAKLGQFHDECPAW